MNCSDCGNHVLFIKEIYEDCDLIINSKKTDKEKLELIEEIIIDNIDSKNVIALVLRDYWVNASKKEKDDFTEEYNKYIKQSYASLVKQYFGKMDIVRTTSIKKLQCVTNARYMYQDSPVYVSYFTIEKGDKIQIYDVAVEGIRMGIVHRDQFKSVLLNSGLNGLIEKLREENNR
ncbi:MAG: ABC transporter substrate-binding protein [Rickettsiaceae bacterium H1]|nr:ABC transporter substrate-binding protein [Rickettsiaceae bacterium H1]